MFDGNRFGAWPQSDAACPKKGASRGSAGLGIMDTTVTVLRASEKKGMGKIERHGPGVGLQGRKWDIGPMDRIAVKEKGIDGVA